MHQLFYVPFLCTNTFFEQILYIGSPIGMSASYIRDVFIVKEKLSLAKQLAKSSLLTLRVWILFSTKGLKLKSPKSGPTTDLNHVVHYSTDG